MRRLPVLIATLAAASAGCKASDDPPPPGCAAPVQRIERALERAPGNVALDVGARLSDCVRKVRTDAELQDLGTTLTTVAHHLAQRASKESHAALALGYLVGAAQRGAAHSPGIPAELVHRLQSMAAVVQRAGVGAAALRRGLAAGERNG
jgi:hypothetical protein